MIETSLLSDQAVNKEISISKDDEEFMATNVPSKSIKAIDKTTVHRICSGQVVLTLATAVKELVENSIDAASTSVEVRLKEHGSCLLEVSDNGNGVEPCDFEGLALKHHTSKLQNFGDLVGVATFGFRGEALSSLCALSNLTVVTRHKNQSVGTKLIFNNNGKLIEKTHVARPVGTTVSLQNLFNTLPVRHKEFLRNLKKEFNKMVQVLYSYCLISTNVRILCTNQCDKNGKTTVVSTESHSSFRENISSIFGTKQVASLLEIKQRSPDGQVLSEYGIEGDADADEYFQLEGFVSSCTHGKGRSAADRQFYFINNRPCDPAKIARVVNEVYHHYNKHQYPTVVLNIRMKQEDVDVNVTPDKRQIMVNRERLLLATIKTTLIFLYEDVPATLQLQSTPLPRLGIHAENSPISPTQRPASSLAQRFSHTANGSSKSPSCGAESGRKSASMTTFGRVKRAFAAHSELETMAKQPRLQDFSFKVNDSKSATQSDLTAIEDNHADQTASTLNNLNCLSNVPSTDLADYIPKDRSVEPENAFEISPIDRVVSNSINGMLKHPNNSLSMEEQQLATSNGQTEPRTLDDFPNPSTPRTPSRAIHSETEKFLSSLRNAKNRASSPVSRTHSKNAESPIRCPIPINYITKDDDSEEVVILDVSLENNENCINVPDATKEDPPALPHVIYDDHVKTTSSPSRGKVLTISFSLDSIRQKLSKSRAHATASGRAMFRRFRAKITPSDNGSAEDELKKQLTKEEFRQMSVVGQFNLGFIVARLEADLFIVDQHATDEKYNFESLQRSCVLHSQKLIVPYTLELTVANETVLLENLDIFSRNGFEFEVDNERVSGRRVALTKMPHSRGWEFSREDVDEMIFMLSDAPGVMCRPSRVNAMFASRACRKSVMVGTPLGRAQMRQLIDHMAEMVQPWNCPHGRPTLRHLINLDLLATFE